jgi:catechol 2,3-dioxygenase-like lactoylglutathione lyase family enzyme
MKRRRLPAWMAGLALAAALALGWTDRAPLPVLTVDSVGFTVANMERSVAFYRDVLGFTVVSDTEATGRPFELLTGVFGANARIVRMQLGDERIELTEFHAPRGRPYPVDLQPNDHAFQHIAIIVRDMDQAYARLRAHGVEHASTGPQRLPDWNPGAGGIKAFYFRDPDRHFLEILEFPPGKGLAKWHAPGDALFLGIDHTAIVVHDTDASLAFYRDVLGLALAGAGENHDIEQERLNNVFGARLRITTLRAAGGPGIELLEYLAPRTGRPAPPDLRANDILHWQTTLVVRGLEPLLPLARAHRVTLVSPGPIPAAVGVFGEAALTRDPDGHGLRLVAKPLAGR